MRTFERDRLIWDSALEPREKFVLLAMTLYLNTKSGTCWPGLERLSIQTGLSEKTVRRAIKNLEAVGAIEVSKRVSGTGKFASNEYRINLEKLPDLPAVNLTSGQFDQRSICPKPAVNLSQTSGQFDRLTYLNELTEMNRSSKSAPEKKSERKEPPIDVMKNQFSNTGIQPWKSGRGPNDWNEDFLKYLCKYWTTPQKAFGRADAIGYISKRQSPDHPEHPTLFARFEEFASRNAPRNVPSAPRESPQAEEKVLPPDYVPEMILQAWRGKKMADIPFQQIREALARETEVLA